MAFPENIHLHTAFVTWLPSPDGQPEMDPLLPNYNMEENKFHS